MGYGLATEAVVAAGQGGNDLHWPSLALAYDLRTLLFAIVYVARMEAGPGARIKPGTRRDIGVVNLGIVRVLGFVSGSGPPNVFTTLARHRRLFRRWLRFAGALMPGGLLARAESELLILRVAHTAAASTSGAITNASAGWPG